MSEANRKQVKCTFPDPTHTYYMRLPESGFQEPAFLTRLPVMQTHPEVGKLRNGKKDQKTHLGVLLTSLIYPPSRSVSCPHSLPPP